MSLEDGAATIIEFTIEIIASKLSSKDIICCGGGRKNQYLIERLEKKINKKILNIDEFEIDGDFIESQAFAYLSIRSYLKKPITYPSTTKVNIPVTGGNLKVNY